MHFEIDGAALKRAASSAMEVASENDERQVLKNVLLSATEEGLELRATDTVTDIRRRVPVGEDLTVTEPGEVVVKARNFLGIAQSGVKHPITVKAKPDALNCVVLAGKSRYRLPMDSVQDFPTVADWKKTLPTVKVNGFFLLEQIRRTSHCAYKVTSRAMMHGLLFRVRDKKLTLAATMGSRLAFANVDVLDAPEGYDAEVIVHATAVPKIKTMLSGTAKEQRTEVVELQLGANHLSVRTPKGTLSLRTLNGTFVPFETGIPKSFPHQIVFNRAQLIEMLTQLTRIKTPGTAFADVVLENNTLTIARLVKEEGDSFSRIDVPWPGEMLKFAINPGFFLEDAKLMRTEEVVFLFGDVMLTPMLREHGKPEIDAATLYAVVMTTTTAEDAAAAAALAQ
jgi:DNA polymerase-3 subunit beta